VGGMGKRKEKKKNGKKWIRESEVVLGLKRRKRFASPRATGLGWGPLVIYGCPIRLTLFRTSNTPLMPVGPTLSLSLPHSPRHNTTTSPIFLSFYLFLTKN